MARPAFFVPKRVFLDGDKTRYILRRNKLRQKQVARRLHITEGQFSQYLDATCSIDFATVAALAQILHVPNPKTLLCDRAECAQ